MDREKLFRYLEQHYTSKREMLSRIPLGIPQESMWQQLLNRRQSKATALPLYDPKGKTYWYVTTEKMVAASEKIINELFENETEYDPYASAPVVSTLEEVFYTSYVEGSQITIQAAMDFLTCGRSPRDIEEQLIANNRQAGNYAGANLYRPINADLLGELILILTEGMDNNGREYRDGEVTDFSSPEGEHFDFTPSWEIPDRINDLTAFLASPTTHPLIKAVVAQAYMMILRPFPEGNERLGRILSNMILIRAGYSFFSDVSLSALIARKSYGYYEAIANILRKENGGDLTYFLEYFLELLSRAVDERRFRLSRKEEQARQAEQEMARTALTVSMQSEPATSDDSHVEDQADLQTAESNYGEKVVSEREVFQPDSVTDMIKNEMADNIRGAPVEKLAYWAAQNWKPRADYQHIC